MKMNAQEKVPILICSDGGMRGFEAASGITVAKALEEAGMPVRTPCGGVGSCCSCATKVWRSGEPSSVRVRACREKVAPGMRVYPVNRVLIDMHVPVPPGARCEERGRAAS